jgi:hypothetical protein
MPWDLTAGGRVLIAIKLLEVAFRDKKFLVTICAARLSVLKQVLKTI